MKDILTSFSPCQDFLAISSGDGRIKIWDTLRGQIQTEFSDITLSGNEEASFFTEAEKGHLSLDYKCMKWVPVYNERKKKKLVTSLLVLGTGSGDVFALDISVGRLKWSVSDCHPGGVNCISFSDKSSSLYTAGADGMVCQLDFTTGDLLRKFKSSKRAISAMAVSVDGSMLATATSQIKVFNCLDMKKMNKFSGHPVSVRCMNFSKDENYVASSGISERYVAIWKADGSKQKAACCILPMEHPAVFVDVQCNTYGGLSVLAVSEMGECWLWCGKDIGELQSRKPSKITVSSPAHEKSALRGHKGDAHVVIAAKINNNIDEDAISVFAAYGSLVKPLFEKLSVKHGTEVSLHTANGGIFLPRDSSKSTKNKVTRANVMALDRANAEDAIHPISKLHDFSEKKRRHDGQFSVIDLKQTFSISDSGVRGELKQMDYKDEQEQIEEEDVETTCLEEKLIALGILSTSTEHNYDRETYLKIHRSLPFYSSELSEVHQHYTNLLIQGSVPVKKIRAAIRSMGSFDAYKFLKFLLAVLQSRSSSARHVLPWIHYILVIHGRYIISEEPSQETLDSILEMTQFKSTTVQSLLQLSGRLQLLMAQIANSKDDKSETAELGKQSVVDSEDDEDEDVDIVQFASSEDDKSSSDVDMQNTGL